jgi:hypothetical protein
MDNNNDTNKVDDSPLSKLRNLQPMMYPVYAEDGTITGYDYGVDLESVESMFPWMIQKDTFGRATLNKDSMICFLLACILEQDRDVEVLYKGQAGNPRIAIKPWSPDAQ